LQLLSYAGATALLGGLLYALIALAYDRFYRSFGVAPDDVGLTSASLVPRTAVALAIFAAIAAGAFCLVALVALLAAWLLDMRPRQEQPADRTTVLLFAFSAAAVVAALVIILWIAPVVQSTPTPTLFVFVIMVAAPIATALIRWFMPQPRRTAALLSLWIGALASIFLAGMIFSYWRAGDLSSLVHAGKPIPSTGLTFVYDFHADPVCVSNINAGGSFPQSPVYRLYLGEANNWLVLYNPETGTTNRVSNNGLLLTFLPVPEDGAGVDGVAQAGQGRAPCCDDIVG
jgi:MFS family permease